MESVPVAGLCNECHRKFEVEGFIFVCPECGSYDVTVEQGQELDIAYIEVDDR
ncbi:MAG: hydrogenase maturation nickel metallochaperone HypA [Candidatus Zixiibacteriota bacterium]|nr:MAG: hydrogenase maturation nickel metallochaperone HypA [candidate division Zixibacteria bacterium]